MPGRRRRRLSRQAAGARQAAACGAQAPSTRGRLAEENRKLKGGDEPPPLLGDSADIQALREEIARVAPARATVLVVGESGTGKELVARRIHHLSPRARDAVRPRQLRRDPRGAASSPSCSATRRGAFTGAVRKQVGKFVQADGGTIFLDEVGDMSLRTQAKVLRVLQDGEVEPVGAGEVRRVDVRVIAATNKDLEDEVKAGRFREDLYFRLAVVLLRTPPLRAHPEDIAGARRPLHQGRVRGVQPPLQALERPRRSRQLAAYPLPGQRPRAQEHRRAGRDHADRRRDPLRRPGRRPPRRGEPELEGVFGAATCRSSRSAPSASTSSGRSSATTGTSPPRRARSRRHAPTCTRRSRRTA